MRITLLKSPYQRATKLTMSGRPTKEAKTCGLTRIMLQDTKKTTEPRKPLSSQTSSNQWMCLKEFTSNL